MLEVHSERRHKHVWFSFRLLVMEMERAIKLYIMKLVNIVESADFWDGTELLGFIYQNNDMMRHNVVETSGFIFTTSGSLKCS